MSGLEGGHDEVQPKLFDHAPRRDEDPEDERLLRGAGQRCVRRHRPGGRAGLLHLRAETEDRLDRELDPRARSPGCRAGPPPGAAAARCRSRDCPGSRDIPVQAASHGSRSPGAVATSRYAGRLSSGAHDGRQHLVERGAEAFDEGLALVEPRQASARSGAGWRARGRRRASAAPAPGARRRRPARWRAGPSAAPALRGARCRASAGNSVTDTSCAMSTPGIRASAACTSWDCTDRPNGQPVPSGPPSAGAAGRTAPGARRRGPRRRRSARGRARRPRPSARRTAGARPATRVPTSRRSSRASRDPLQRALVGDRGPRGGSGRPRRRPRAARRARGRRRPGRPRGSGAQCTRAASGATSRASCSKSSAVTARPRERSSIGPRDLGVVQRLGLGAADRRRRGSRPGRRTGRSSSAPAPGRAATLPRRPPPVRYDVEPQHAPRRRAPRRSGAAPPSGQPHRRPELHLAGVRVDPEVPVVRRPTPRSAAPRSTSCSLLPGQHGQGAAARREASDRPPLQREALAGRAVGAAERSRACTHLGVDHRRRAADGERRDRVRPSATRV